MILQRAVSIVALAGAAAGCGGGQAAPRTSDSPIDSVVPMRGDTLSGTLIPAGFGTLRQDDISIRLQIGGKQVKALPLDESVIRTLSADSYRALRGLQESVRAQINDVAQRSGTQRYSLWYVSFYGIEPDARFSPRDVIITSSGRDFRPIDVLPLSSGFGSQRLAQREVQQAIYLFDASVDLTQPLTVTIEGTLSTSWGSTLRRIELERALIRSRASRGS